MDKMKLTSVKILNSLYESFKSVTVNTKMSLQKITNRSVYLYIHDKEFKDKINSADYLHASGSNL
jgi:UDP-N-acetyl-D-mannosaminuronic acid transferase (WecB/TagA/CpsF family)